MFTLRCTQKILDRIKLKRKEVAEADLEPTTALGDWYVNTLNIGPERWVICVSSRSLLSVVIPARELGNMPDSLTRRVGALLADLGAPATAIAREQREMEEMAYGVTRDRSVVGSMKDLGDLARHWREITEGEVGLTRKLADVPCSPLKGSFPSDVAVELLSRWELRLA
jgi:hypothetical protein